MRQLQSILNAIRSGNLLSPEFFDFDHDEALDKRDQDPFDTEWVRAHRNVKDTPVSAAQEELLLEIRKAAFLGTMEATDNSDLAGYISDDLDLLARGLLADAADPWLNRLWAHYCEDKFPTGELQPLPGNLRVLVDEVAWG
jgi:hypothetical protein